MTATITEVKEGLANRLATITGLRAFAYQPDQLNAPIAFSLLENISFHRTMRTALTEMTFTVTVIVCKADSRAAQSQVDPYVSATGAYSIKAAIEGDRTLGGKVDDLIVNSAGGYQIISAEDADYLSVDFNVTVYS
jgi:hypothetical protein